MIRFILADLQRLQAGAMIVVLLVAFATALGMAVRIEERALRLGSARAADRFDVVIGAPGSETQLVLSSIFLQPSPLALVSGDVLKQLSEDPRVDHAAPVGFGDSYHGYPIIGTTAEFIEKSGFRIEGEGRNFSALSEAVVGARVPMAVGDEFSPQHGLAGQAAEEHHEMSYRITGRMEPSATPWDRAILVPIEGVWHVHGLGLGPGEEGYHDGHDQHHEHDDHDHDEEHDHDDEHGEHHIEAGHLGPPWPSDMPGVPAILVKPRTIANAYQIRGDYRTETAMAVFPGEVLTRLYATLGDARLVLTAIAIGTQMLAGTAVILVTMAHLSQRRRQIGALRAFGAPRLAVFAVVWSELLIVIGLGVAAGIGLGYAGAKALAILFARQSGMALPVTLEMSDLAFAGMLLAVAALIAVVPAIYAYRQSPAAALRG
ncbi:ABC transporter permease [Paracoccus siganidrum]|uniref:ABC transporter permease n=1 Tax=Paracoccus siganidrum TaxID=1276757 RepID=A0A418ZVB0_9RHOB|nr:ABC transporter permease [Paracoccus siganidrum]RJL02297.1 ABC transporter permease [Paracoccus siganidrum]RMC24725.1 ABC transporter permease [Paracoccus siganidrum]